MARITLREEDIKKKQGQGGKISVKERAPQPVQPAPKENLVLKLTESLERIANTVSGIARESMNVTAENREIINNVLVELKKEPPEKEKRKVRYKLIRKNGQVEEITATEI